MTAAEMRDIDTSPLMREIAYDPPSKHAQAAAGLLAFLIPNIRVRGSWLIPGQAVWSLDGEPMLPEGAS